MNYRKPFMKAGITLMTLLTAVGPLAGTIAQAKDHTLQVRLGLAVGAAVNNQDNENDNDKDNNGNGNKKIDVTAPQILSIAVKATTNTSATIRWSTHEKTRGSVDYGTSSSYGLSARHDNGLKKTHTVKLTGLSAGTTYHFKVNAKDKAGNSVSSDDRTFVTLSDVTAPSISDVRVSAISQTAGTVSWRTNEPADSQVMFGTTASYGLSTSLDSNLTQDHLQVLTGLSANTTYHFQVQSKDAAGNLSVSDDATFKTAVAADVTPPVISALTITDVSADTALVGWTTSEAANSRIYISTGTPVDKSTATTFTVSALVTHRTILLTGLSSNTKYYIIVESTDAAGNVGTSSELSFMTK